MLHEVADAMAAEKRSNVLSSQTMIKCSTPNCAGFSYSSGVACTVCNKIIKPTPEFADEITSQAKVEQIGAKRRLIEQPVKNVSCSPQSTFSYPLVVLSIGKVGVFDARQKPCIISSRELSFSFHDEVTWIPVRVSAEEVNCIMFCERIQVIFLRPTEALMRKLLKEIRSTGTSRNTECLSWFTYDIFLGDKMWLTIVLKDIPQIRNIPDSSGPSPYLTVQQLEVFTSSVRLAGGHCVMEFSYDLAQKLLIANGVKLTRPNNTLPAVSTAGISNVGSLVPKKTTPSFTLLSPAHIENMASDPNFCISDSAKSSDATSKKDAQLAAPTPPQVLNEDLVILTDDSTPTVPSTELNSSHDSQAPNGLLDFFVICGLSPSLSLKLNRFVYRPPGSSDGILLTTEDVACLTPGSFLNDTIINFYLKYLFFEQLSAFQRQATHLFNCFFYSRLSSPPAPSAVVPNCPTDNSSPDHSTVIILFYSDNLYKAENNYVKA
ncbi:unnamed protein product [Dibothriocephalus latus]|uniref:Ubiquitin-like protease family profile domain-containing protein n=1 Tax=Dibothriocephalus latus TaxID=60516 RepID=A0A3P7LYH6_DIBLA|nr:unnamed protein product [Dibothriocephalus latus]